MKNSRGIALVLMAGLVALTALLALAIGRGARLAAAGAGWRLAQAASALAAESGLHYAAARLANGRSDMSTPRTYEARGDDWQYRDGAEYRFEPDSGTPWHAASPVPLHESLNPSYGRGEPWEDIVNDGRFVQGQDAPGTNDLDGDKRLSAWSGRLRGGAHPFSLRYLLQIEAGPTGKLSVNDGNLASAWVPGLWGFGFEIDGNAPLAGFLNLLGVVLDVRTRPIPNSDTHPPEFRLVTISDLGSQILERRPRPYGYTSMEALRRALVETTPAILTENEWRKLEPCLTVFRDVVTGTQARYLDLQTAPHPLLAAYFLYQRAKGYSLYFDYAGGTGNENISPPRRDPVYDMNWGSPLFMSSEDAAAIASGITLARRGATRHDIRNAKELHALFFDALRGVLDGIPPGHVLPDNPLTPMNETDLYAATKANLAASVIQISGPPAWSKYTDWTTTSFTSRSLMSWTSGELDCDTARPGTQANMQIVELDTVCLPRTLAGYSRSSPYDLLEDRTHPTSRIFRGLYTLWRGDPQTFTVSCLATTRSPDGNPTNFLQSPIATVDLRLTVPLLATSQEDFENVSYRRSNANPYISDPNGRGNPRELPHGIRAEGLGQMHNVQTFPFFSRRSFWPLGAFDNDHQLGALTLAEWNDADYPIDDPRAHDFSIDPAPTLIWTFTPDREQDYPEGLHWPDDGKLSGLHHVRGSGTYPFDDLPVDSHSVRFRTGDPLYAYPNEGDDSNPLPGMLNDLAFPYCGLVGDGASNLFLLSRTYTNARIPAPIRRAHPASGCAASRPLWVEPLPSDDPARYLDEGGIEAWISPGKIQNLSPGWSISGRYFETMDSTGYSEPSVELACHVEKSFTRYTLTWNYKLPVIGQSVWDNEDEEWEFDGKYWPQEYPAEELFFRNNAEVEWLVPTRGDVQTPQYDHVLVEWKTLGITYDDPLTPKNETRVEVRLRIFCNGQLVSDTVQTTEELDDDGDGVFGEPAEPRNVDLDGDGVFGEVPETRYGFIPPWSRADPLRRDSYLKFVFDGCDQIAFYNQFGAGNRFKLGAPLQDRFFLKGSYESPLYVLPSPGKVTWAGWTKIVSEKIRDLTAGSLICRIAGYSDESGLNQIFSEDIDSLNRCSRFLDGEDVRSIRFFLAWDVPDVQDVRDIPPFPPPPSTLPFTGAFIDPPVCEDFAASVRLGTRWLRVETRQ